MGQTKTEVDEPTKLPTVVPCPDLEYGETLRPRPGQLRSTQFETMEKKKS
jgi:hypothetical protein